LQALKDISENDYINAKKLLEKNIIKLLLKTDVNGIFVRILCNTDKSKTIEVIIKGKHSNVNLIKINDTIVYSKKSSKSKYEQKSLTKNSNLKNASIENMLSYIENISEFETNLINESIKLNLNISETGKKNYNTDKIFKNISKKYFGLDFDDNISLKISEYLYAGIKTRMSGKDIPVMSSGGSGNAGITAVLPVYLYGQKINFNKTKIIKAIGLSHIINSFVRLFIGRIGSLCGGVVAAGAGSAAGIAYLYEATPEKIENSIELYLNSTFGILCDGAKLSCSLKISSVANLILNSAFLALENFKLNRNEGLIGNNFLETMKNTEYMSSQIDNVVDNSIIDIIRKKL
jgi:L-cysteine desulfidase